jgi:OmcA/MtrC family decaheme c-type cytochrome
LLPRCVERECARASAGTTTGMHKTTQHLVTILVLTAGGCAGDDGSPGANGVDGVPGVDGQDGRDGQDGGSCSITDNGDGTKTISCDDGTNVTVADGQTGQTGQDGQDGASCTITDNGDGTKTVACTDGTTATIRDGATAAEVFSLLAEMPKKLVVTIDSVTIASAPVINFTVRDDPAGRGAVGLRAGGTGQLRFTVAKLVPGATGGPDTWKSYINTNRTGATTALGAPALASALQATSENNGSLVDHGDGTYTYTFATDVGAVSAPEPVTFDASLTHRVAIQMSGSVAGVALPAANATFDLRPDGNAITVTRDIVQTSSCNECHGKLALHGGGRVDTEYCVTCHNPGTRDPESGNSVNFPYMVHAIHGATKRAEQGLPPFEIAGFGGTVADFSEVTYPQALNNCLKCHNAADAGTPDASNWEERPYREACSGCHDVDAAGNGVVNHVSQADSMCTVCHAPNSIVPIATAHQSEDATPNTPQVIEGAYTFTYEIRRVTMVDANHPAIELRILLDGAPITNFASSYLTGARPSGLGLTGGPSFLLAYALPQDGLATPADFNNLGRAAAQPLSVSLASLASGSAGTLSTADADGFVTATLTGANQYPTGAQLRTVALQGYWSQVSFFTPCPPSPASCNLARHAVSVEKTVTGDTDRRQIVDSAKCGNCHEWFLGHGGNRVYTTDVCIMCHNPNFTSSGRGADPATSVARLGTEAADAMTAAGYTPSNPLTFPEESMSFKALIHGVHSASKRDDDFDFVRDRGTSGVFYYDMAEVTFPGVLNNCETCHKPGTYDVDLPPDLLNTTVQVPGVAFTGASGNAATACDDTLGVNESSFQNILAARAAPCLPNDTDLVSTPIAATCNGCHTTAIAELHMVEHGAYLRERRSDVSANLDGQIETCTLCHGPGRLADVGVLHMK